MVATVLSACAIFGWAYGRFFPDPPGLLGLDYEIFLSQLEAGSFWLRRNGPLSVPWFTPAFLGGMPFFASPQGMFYSVPQLLHHVLGPVDGLRATLLCFGLAGFGSMHMLLRRGFALIPELALSGGVLWMLHSFFGVRMVVGHLPFHALMLLPLHALCVILAAEATRWRRRAAWTALAGCVGAYLFYGGAAHMFLPFVLGVLLLLVVYAWVRERSMIKALAMLGVSLTVSGVVAAAKISAALHLMHWFPRADLALPGLASLGDAVWFPLRMLFLGPLGREAAMEAFRNMAYSIGPHEMAYNVSLAPIAMLLLAAVAGKAHLLPRKPLRSAVFGGGLLLLCAVPVLLNWYTPGWNAFLKSLPVVRNSSLNLRWYEALAPLAIVGPCVLAGYWLGGMEGRRHKAAALFVPLALAAALGAFASGPDYGGLMGYDSRVMLHAHGLENVPPVADVAVITSNGQVVIDAQYNALFALGHTGLYGYQPLFGYRLERFPRGPLHPGPVLDARDGIFNMKRPECYVFPEKNQCRPGDHFTVDQVDALQRFRHYRPHDFRMSGAQLAANGVTLVGLALCVPCMFWGFLPRRS